MKKHLDIVLFLFVLVGISICAQAEESHPLHDRVILRIQPPEMEMVSPGQQVPISGVVENQSDMDLKIEILVEMGKKELARRSKRLRENDRWTWKELVGIPISTVGYVFFNVTLSVDGVAISQQTAYYSVETVDEEFLAHFVSVKLESVFLRTESKKVFIFDKSRNPFVVYTRNNSDRRIQPFEIRVEAQPSSLFPVEVILVPELGPGELWSYEFQLPVQCGRSCESGAIVVRVFGENDERPSFEDSYVVRTVALEERIVTDRFVEIERELGLYLLPDEGSSIVGSVKPGAMVYRLRDENAFSRIAFFDTELGDTPSMTLSLGWVRFDPVVPGKPSVELLVRPGDLANGADKVELRFEVSEGWSPQVWILRRVADGPQDPGELLDQGAVRDRLIRSRVVELQKGENRLLLEVFGTDSGLQEIHVRKEFVIVGPPLERVFVLIVGVGEYGDGIPKIELAMNDVAEIERMFRSIEFLYEGRKAVEVRKLIGDKATVPKLKRELRKLSESVSVDDAFFAYFAVHGFELWSGHPERRIPDHYVALKDARCDEEWDRSCRNAGTFDGSRLDYETLLATAELIRLIDKIRPGIGLLMFDACHVGGSTKAVRVANWDNGYVSGSSINDAMHFFFGAGKTETAKGIKGLGFGAFTFSVLSAVQGSAFVNGRVKEFLAENLKGFDIGSRDQFIERIRQGGDDEEEVDGLQAKELELFVVRSVEDILKGLKLHQEGVRQTPFMSHIKGEAGDTIFDRTVIEFFRQLS